MMYSFLLMYCSAFGFQSLGDAKSIREMAVAENRIQGEESGQNTADVTNQHQAGQVQEEIFTKRFILYVIIILFFALPYRKGREVLAPHERFLLYITFIFFLLWAGAAMEN
jgi:hypothetical protein